MPVHPLSTAANAVLLAGILVPLLAVLWPVLWPGVLAAIRHTWLDRASAELTPPAAADLRGWWHNTENASWANSSNTAAVAAMQQQLQQARAALSSSVTLDAVKVALKGSTLPKGVTLKAVQQLLIDQQLLSLSLNSSSFAAARVAAMRSHYSTARVDQQQQVEHQQQLEQQQQQQQQQVLKQQQQQQQLPGVTHSRGILIVGGSRTHLGNAYILLRVLRDTLHCSLPVEVVYYGSRELDPVAARLVTAFAAQQAAAGAAPIRLIDGLLLHQQHLQPLLPHPEVPLTSWVAKVHALCWVTSFQQVLLLDSDNMPTQDPALLFQDPAFTARGFLAWPDFWTNLWMEPVLYRLLGLPVPWEVARQGLAAESGQLLLDRARHADVLEWLWLLNAHSGVVYRCLIGDKDTYRMAFQLAGKGEDYVQVPHPPRQLLLDTGSNQQRHRFIHLGMGQASPDGCALLFMHRTARGKYFPWCAASLQLQGSGSSSCQPSWLTQSVTQEQLLASVPDPGSMRYDAGSIDTEWHTAACTPAAEAATPAAQAAGGAGAAGAGATGEAAVGASQEKQSCSGTCRGHETHQGGSSAGSPGVAPSASKCGQQSSPWVMQLPVCSNSTGQLPIPVVPVASVPGLQQLMAAVSAVFKEAAAVLPVPLYDRYKVLWGIL